MPTSPSNQLGTGAPATPPPQAMQTPTAEAQETWDEDNWSQPQPLQEPLRKPEPVYEESNWGDEPEPAYREAAYLDEAPYADYQEPQLEPEEESPYEDYDVTSDAWGDDDNPKPYQAPKINIPEKKRVVEYEEETDY